MHFQTLSILKEKKIVVAACLSAEYIKDSILGDTHAMQPLKIKRPSITIDKKKAFLYLTNLS